MGGRDRQQHPLTLRTKTAAKIAMQELHTVSSLSYAHKSEYVSVDSLPTS
jgi:hypothetical protein